MLFKSESLHNLVHPDDVERLLVVIHLLETINITAEQAIICAFLPFKQPLLNFL